MKKKICLILVLLKISSFSFSQTIDDYFTIAAENSPGLKVSYKAFEAAMEKVPQMGSLPDPNLSFGYFVSPVETRVGPQRARFSLTQMFPWFGTLKSQRDASALMAEAKYQLFLDARNKLYYQVSAAYYPLFELRQLELLEQDNIAVLESIKELANVKFKNGRTAMVDVLSVDIILKDATTNLSILHQKKRPLEVRFNNLLNRGEFESIEVADSLRLPILPAEYRRDSLPAMNPLLEALDLNIRASQAGEQVAIKQGLPKFGVGLDYVVVGERADMSLPDNGKDVLMPMVTVSLPIFRNKYKATQNETRLMKESFVLQKEDLTNQLNSAYEMAWFETQKQIELIQLYDQQLLTTSQSLSLLLKAYSNSDRDVEEVLRKQQQLLRYKKMKVTALAAYYITLAELDYITAQTR
jgi:outer membrane protein TolC